MKRRLLAYMLLASLLGTGGVIFMQPGFTQQSEQAIQSIEQVVATKTQPTLSIVKHSELINSILLLLAGVLFLGGLITLKTKKYFSYSFGYTQSLLYNTPEKEKDRRFSRDDVL